jgi:hypothetical protein
MHEHLERRVRAAAVAGWWTLLAGFAVLLVQWFAYLFMSRARPEWATFLLGPGVSWDYLLQVWWIGTALFKGLLLVLALPCLWLTLWARQLRKTAGA